MTTTSGVGESLNHLNIGTKTAEDPKKNELGQTAFLELMITQLENQDPLNPQENSEFIAQLAQFSSVEGLERLNSNFEGFTNNFTSNRALQASSLVGRTVTIPGDSSYLVEGGIVSGVATLPATTTDLSISIYDGSGALVEQVPVGFFKKGDVNFRWDGMRFEVNGEIVPTSKIRNEPLPPGKYEFAVTATQDGKEEELALGVSANVNSVTVESDGNIVLNLAGFGSVNLSDVKQFN